MIEVKAVRTGYINHSLKKEGDVFIIEEKDCKKGADGKVILPSWVKAESEAKAEVKAEPEVQVKKSKDKVI